MPDDTQPGRFNMSKEDFFARLVGAARARGIAHPVAIVFDSGSAQAQAVYADLAGEPMPAAPLDGAEPVPCEVADPAEAVRLLRRHAGPGGALAAEHIEDEALAAEWWVVVLLPDALAVSAWSGGAEVLRGKWAYDRVSPSLQPLGKLLEDDGRSRLTLAAEGGSPPLDIYGRSGIDVGMASVLAAVASDYPGFTELPDPSNGDRPVRVRVTPELVRSLLSSMYIDCPHPVAEAVRALRKAAPDKAEWLLKLMRNSPGLLELYRATRRELTGEEG
jgi:hypothetical protein